MNKMTNRAQLSRPLKLNLDEVINTIEEIYTKRFAEDSCFIFKNLQPPQITLQVYLYDFFFKKIKQKERANQQIINFLGSVEMYCQKYKQIGQFKQFLKNYRVDSVTFYLFLRAVVQKTINIQFYHPLRKKCLDQSTIQINYRQIQSIIQIVFEQGWNQALQELKYCQKQYNVSDFQSKCVEIYQMKNMQNTQKQFQNMHEQQESVSHIEQRELESEISDYDCLLKRIQSQQEVSQQAPPLFQNTQPSARFTFSRLHQNAQSDLQKQINTQLELQIADFVDDMLQEIEDITEDQKDECFKEIEDKIQEYITSLLDAIYKFDKMIWFKRISLNPDEGSLIYIENLQIQYKKLTKHFDIKEIEGFCKSVMQTPELAKQIGNELVNYFYQHQDSLLK
ncbi:hypothetical protein pb186bvf_001618 [Paramecium bursaria]